MVESVLPRVTSWLALALACIIAFAPAASMRLCFEPGGAVALEDAALPGSCGEPEQEDEGEHFARPRSACCACLDVPIGNPAHEDALARAAEQVVALVWPVTFVVVELARPLAQMDRGLAQASAPAGPPRAVAHLRSFVLRV